MGYEKFNETAASGVCEYLTEAQSLVILYLAVRVNKEHGEAYPSLAKVAYEIGLKKDTVSKAITALRRLDLVRSRRVWSQVSRTLVTYYQVAPADHIDALLAEWDPHIVVMRAAGKGRLNILTLQRQLARLTPPPAESPLPGDQLQLVSEATN